LKNFLGKVNIGKVARFDGIIHAVLNLKSEI